MKFARTGLLLGFLVALLGVSVAQESLPPIQIGGGGSSTRQTNGQIVEVVVVGDLTVNVFYTEISSQRVTGHVYRLSGDPTSGSVQIRWLNRGRETMLSLGPQNPDDPFGMEGGDVDKRGPSGDMTN